MNALVSNNWVPVSGKVGKRLPEIEVECGIAVYRKICREERIYGWKLFNRTGE